MRSYSNDKIVNFVIEVGHSFVANEFKPAVGTEAIPMISIVLAAAQFLSRR
jgi:hypothetical protein